MYHNNDFHESYYNHTCLIIPEKDVLEIDIKGTGCTTAISRWWNDLFLLSFTSDSSRGFYTSSHAMRIERFRQFRKFKTRIHPLSKFRNFWDCLILHVFILHKLIFKFTSSFIFDDLPMIMFYTGAFLELIIVGDLYVNLKSGFINNEAKRVVLDTKQCLINFCTKKLLIHVASAMPLHWFMILRYGLYISCGMCKTNRFICVLKIINVISLIRVYETSDYWTQKCRNSNRVYFFKFLRILVISLITLYTYYDVCDAVCLLVFINSGEVVGSSLLALRATFKYGVTKELPHNYMYASYDINRIFKSLQLFSFGIRPRVYYLDKMTALFGYALAKTFYIWFLLEAYAFINQQVYSKDMFLTLKYRALALLSSRQLNDDLCLKVNDYFNFKPVQYLSAEYSNEMYRCLPEVLKKEAMLNSYLKLVMRIPFFTDLPLPLLEQIVVLLKKEVYLKNAAVAQTWAPSNGLMIIDKGVMAVYSKDSKERGHLIDGDFFGGLALVTDKELCMSSVVAVTSCIILVLEKKIFRNFMRDHPIQFSNMEMQIKKYYQRRSSKSLVKSSRKSDLSEVPAVKYWDT